MAQGKRDKEIAIILGISYRTVTHHVSAILQKLCVETRTAAVAVAIPPDMQALQSGQKADKIGNLTDRNLHLRGT